MDKIYIIKYSTDYAEDYDEINIFATTDKEAAISYVKRFKSILSKWVKYYSQYELTKHGMSWLNPVNIQYYNRWNNLRRINNCFYKEVELRN